jgi:hypothetical protein
MSNEAQKYNLATIRQLLIAAFTAETLRRFCQDRPTLRPALDEFGPGQGLNEMVARVIDYCEMQVLFGELLAEVRQHNPRQYSNFEKCLFLHDDAPAQRVPRKQPSAAPTDEQGENNSLAETKVFGCSVRSTIILFLTLLVSVALLIVVWNLLKSPKAEERYSGSTLRVTQTGSAIEAENISKSPIAIRFSWDHSDPDGIGLGEDTYLDDWVPSGQTVERPFLDHDSVQIWAWAASGPLVDYTSFRLHP